MDDPTGELRRQRELVAAHLRWLDEQIARTAGVAAPAPPPMATAASIPPPVAAMAPAPPLHATAVPPASAALPDIAMPEIDPGSIRNEVRRGCFIYVVVATVLLAASVAVAIWVGGQ